MSEISTQIRGSVNQLMREFDVITNNLANISTVGYKGRCNTFSKTLKAQEAAMVPGKKNDFDLNAAFDFSQGNMIETGRPLDFAILGKGFFVVETPDGPLYTRNGMFRVNRNRQISDAAGNIIAGQSGPITIPPDAGISQLHIAADGSVTAGNTPIGKFKVMDFAENEKELEPAGASCFKAPEDIDPVPAKNAVVKQGFEESSNVNMVEELTDMIMVQRLYEANIKFITARKEVSSGLLGLAMG